jgi:hypothetical protein
MYGFWLTWQTNLEWFKVVSLLIPKAGVQMMAVLSTKQKTKEK